MPSKHPPPNHHGKAPRSPRKHTTPKRTDHHARNSTPAAKARRRRYLDSPKGKAKQRRNTATYAATERGQRQRERWQAIERSRIHFLPGLSTVTRQTLQRPRLTYIDAHGTVHTETELSAEQLIADFEKHRKKRRGLPQ
jgi:DNA-binding PadR family transcriptional regulator